MKVTVVVNPTAGRGRGARCAPAVLHALRARGFQVREITAAGIVEARSRARDALAEGTDAVFVVGGDGMAHLGVNVCAGTGVPLAIVPAGTGNDSALVHGMPDDPVAAAITAADLLATGAVRTLDAGRVRCADDSEHWFLAVLSLGFDALVNERANGWAWPRGKARYNLAIARELPVFSPVGYRLAIDGQVTDTAGMLVSIANGPNFGGGMRIAPDAVTDDGLLDVVVLRPVSIPEFVRVFPKVFTGGHVDHPQVSITRASTVRVEPLDRVIIAYADGERLGPAPVDCQVVPGAVRLLAP